MCNLTSHGHDEKHEPVKEQYGPKDGNIKHGEEGHEECYEKCTCYGVPEKHKESSQVVTQLNSLHT